MNTHYSLFIIHYWFKSSHWCQTHLQKETRLFGGGSIFFCF